MSGGVKSLIPLSTSLSGNGIAVFAMSLYVEPLFVLFADVCMGGGLDSFLACFFESYFMLRYWDT